MLTGNVKGGFWAFSVPLSLQPLYGYLLEAKCHIHASGLGLSVNFDWL